MCTCGSPAGVDRTEGSTPQATKHRPGLFVWCEWPREVQLPGVSGRSRGHRSAPRRWCPPYTREHPSDERRPRPRSTGGLASQKEAGKRTCQELWRPGFDPPARAFSWQIRRRRGRSGPHARVTDPIEVVGVSRFTVRRRSCLFPSTGGRA